MILGQEWRSKLFQTSILSSLITGCLMSYLRMASLTFSELFSFLNLALWHPIKTIEFSPLNFYSRYSRSGRTCKQLMQQ